MSALDDFRALYVEARARRAAALAALYALYYEDGTPTEEFVATRQVSPGASGAGVGTHHQLAWRELARCHDECHHLAVEIVAQMRQAGP